MKLDRTSLNKITDGAHRIMVYGFKDCLYQKVENAIIHLGLQAESWSYQSFNTINYDAIDFNLKNSFLTCGRMCKSILTSLFLENYKRSQDGRPLIPLIFCIEKEDEKGICSLDLKKLAHTRNIPGCITDEELRRAYKSYKEAGPEFQKIILDTLKFVRVKQNSQDHKLYELELLPPFWQNPEWENLWQERQEFKSQRGNKNYFLKYISFWNNEELKQVESFLKEKKPEKRYLWREIVNEQFPDAEVNPFTGKRNKFFYSNPETHTSDQEMVNSAFGKSSALASKLAK